jgi:fermentation-respiration switch protein FrsA (DUF1100 family)
MLTVNHLVGFGAATPAATSTGSGRYWRLLFSGALYDSGTKLSIQEVQLFAAADGSGTDLTTGATATAGSVYSSGYEAYRANDDNTGTMWVSADNDVSGAWLRFDLGVACLVRAATLTVYSAAGARVTNSVLLQCSDDGASWSNVATLSPANTSALQSFLNLQ